MGYLTTLIKERIDEILTNIASYLEDDEYTDGDRIYHALNYIKDIWSRDGDAL